MSLPLRPTVVAAVRLQQIHHFVRVCRYNTTATIEKETKEATTAVVRTEFPPPLHRPIPHLSLTSSPRTWTHLFSLRTRSIVHLLSSQTPLPSLVLAKLLAHRNINPQDLARWVDALSVRDPARALELLGLLDSAPGHEMSVPNWLMLAIPGLVEKREDVPYLLGFLLSERVGRLREDSVADYGLLVARTVQHCLKVGHWVSVREVVEWFCSTSNDHPLITYNRLLTALASHPSKSTSFSSPPKHLLHSLSSLLLSTLRKRSLRPTLDTYHPLFHPSLIPDSPPDALALLVAFQQDGMEVRKKQLKAVLRVYAAKAQVEEVERMREVVRGMMGGEDGEEEEGESEEEEELDRKIKYDTVDMAHLESLQMDPKGAIRHLQVLREEAFSRGEDEVDRRTLGLIIRILARSESISSGELLGAFREIKKPSMEVYSTVMQGLLSRGRRRDTRTLWIELKDKGVQVDKRVLDVVARTFSDPVKSEAFLEQYAKTARSTKMGTTNVVVATTGPIQLDIVPLNGLLSSYSHSQSYDQFFRLWSSLHSYWGVSPDSATISILLDAARFASAASGNGYGPGLEGIEWSGRKEYSGNWKGDQPWEYADRVVKRLLRQNWPGAIKSGRIGSPLRRGFVGRLERWWEREDGEEEDRPFKATLNPDPIDFPQIVPSARMFRSYFQLLGYHSTPYQVAVALSWARYLDVKPNRMTLTIVLMYIGEGAPSRTEEENLRMWLVDWMGEENVPTDEEVAMVRANKRAKSVV